MNLFIKCTLAFLIAFVLLSGNVIIAGAALSDKSSVQDCIENPDSCQQEQHRAANNSQSSQEEKSTDSIGIGFLEIVRLIAALAFVVALLYFSLRFVNKKSRSYQESHIVHHLGGTALGGSRSVQIVKVGERVLVLGVGDDVSLLKEIDDPGERSQLIDRFEEQSDKMLHPAELLSKLKNRSSKQNKPEDRTLFKKEFERKINELKKIRGQAIQDLTGRERNQDE